MTLEAKKIDIVKWVLGLSDEKVIDQIAESVQSIQESASPAGSIFTTYSAISSKKFDLNQLKKEQNYQPFNPGELDHLIKEADVQEPIEVLLESIGE